MNDFNRYTAKHFHETILVFHDNWNLLSKSLIQTCDP